MKHRVLLPLYAGGVGLVGLALCVIFALELPNSSPSTPWVTAGLLTTGLMMANLSTPIDVSRGRTASTVNLSTGFAMALALVAPLAVPMLAHVAATAFQDIRRRAGWMRLSFNSGVSVIAFLGMRSVFEAVTARSTVTLDVLPPLEVVGLLVAGLAYVAINHLLLTTVLWLASGEPLLRVLGQDIPTNLVGVGVDFGVVALSIPVLQYSPLLFPVMLLPVAALYLSSRLRAAKEQEALHDVLTGLPNRALLHENIADAARLLGPDQALAVMLVDLDFFKQVNDTLGHPVGDQLLREVAVRLTSQVREGDTVARLGGDEFAVLLHLDDDNPGERGLELGRRIVAALSEPMVLGGVRTEVGGSVGFAVAPEHGLDAEELLARADIALYVAKERRGAVELYDPSQEKDAAGRLRLLNELRDGIARQEIELHFEPEVRTADDEVARMHAGVYWRHPTRGLLGPEHFVALAESTGLVVSLTSTVLQLAVAEIRRWSATGAHYGVTVSLSARHLTDRALADSLDTLLGDSGIAPPLLTLSFPEAMVTANRSRSSALMRQVRRRGVSVAIDDFGQGEASLAALRALDVDRVGLAPTLVARLLNSEPDRVIIASTIELAHSLGLEVVAAGVADEPTRRRLHELGCDLVRGPAAGEPVDPEQLRDWLLERRQPAAAPERA